MNRDLFFLAESHFFFFEQSIYLALSDDMINNFCATAFCLFNSLVARRLTLLLPKRENPAIQGLRDKLVMDLKPCFRYIDYEKKDSIRVVSPMVLLLEGTHLLDDAGIG